MVFLIKPQFECGKEIATKYKGIVLNKNIHKEIIKDLFTYFRPLNFHILNLTWSPIKGDNGNIEYLAFLSNKEDSVDNDNINISSIVNSAFKQNY